MSWHKINKKKLTEEEDEEEDSGWNTTPADADSLAQMPKCVTLIFSAPNIGLFGDFLRFGDKAQILRPPVYLCWKNQKRKISPRAHGPFSRGGEGQFLSSATVKGNM